MGLFNFQRYKGLFNSNRKKKPQITPRKRYKLARRAKNKLNRGDQRILPVSLQRRAILSLPFNPKNRLPIKY